MFTKQYKPGYFIHGYCDRPECAWQGPDYIVHKAESIHAAKIAITKAIKSGADQ
jgi:hypothetical protein